MAKRKVKRSAKRITGIIVLIIALISVVLARNNESFNTAPSATAAVLDETAVNEVVVHFIDVGQGSSVLVQCGEKGILIDAGEKSYGDDVADYIRQSGVTKLSCVIATHPHSDHIGGLPQVLSEIPTDSIIMPMLSEANTPTTKTYENLLTAISDGGIKAIAANFADTYSFGNAKLEILGPINQDDEMNNMSVVCRLTAFSTRFMLLADAEKPELSDIYSSGAELESDILQVGHHGSETALFYPFLDKVNADFGVISCGKDNKYGLPDEETLSYFEENNVELYRTDELGSIIFTCTEEGCKVRSQS